MRSVSTLLHPTGPQPSGVYWVRRVVAILVILALLLGVRWLLIDPAQAHGLNGFMAGDLSRSRLEQAADFGSVIVYAIAPAR